MIVKYIRIEKNKIIIVPTAEGLEWIKQNPLKLVSNNNPSGLPFKSYEEKAGGVDLIAYAAEVVDNLIYLQIEASVVNNTYHVRVFDGSVNHYINMPCRALSNTDSKF